MEVAGEVAALGPGANRFQVGTPVMAIVGGGGQAELVVVHERQLMPVPEELDWPHAGGAPEVFITAHDALFTQAGLCSGERLLVHGGAGGVGTAAIQLGRATGARVTATVRNEALRDQVAALGASVMGDIEALQTWGRISVIGTGGGARADLHLGALMAKRGRILASTLRARPLEEKALAARALERSVLPLLASGQIVVPLFATFELERAAEAYDAFAVGGKLGKIVLTIP
jgi:NADPH:quinone reductase-like Zn-dependent oxidoreductase